MPRIERKKSTSGIYHIMIRGNEQRDLYIDDEDRMRFLESSPTTYWNDKKHGENRPHPHRSYRPCIKS